MIKFKEYYDRRHYLTEMDQPSFNVWFSYQVGVAIEKSTRGWAQIYYGSLEIISKNVYKVEDITKKDLEEIFYKSKFLVNYNLLEIFKDVYDIASKPIKNIKNYPEDLLDRRLKVANAAMGFINLGKDELEEQYINFAFDAIKNRKKFGIEDFAEKYADHMSEAGAL
jgi:hypothetical protein